MADLERIATIIKAIIQEEGIEIDRIHQLELGRIFSIDIKTMPGKNPKQVELILRQIERILLKALSDVREPFYLRSKPESEDSMVIV